MPAKDVDEYLAAVREPYRGALEDLRLQIRAAAPDAVEVISYGVPSYKLNGHLVSFGAAKTHCSFYPGGIVGEFADELSDFKTSKGTIQFRPDEPLPAELVARIVEARVVQNEANRATKR